MQRKYISLLMISGIATTSAAVADGRSPHGRKPVEKFETVSLCVERNATDADTEIVLQAVPADDGLRHFEVRAPDGRRVFAFSSADPSVLGIREFELESPEPAGDRILAAYPEGSYRFAGQTHAGLLFFSKARLSHQMPDPAVIIAPIEGEEIPLSDLTIRWSPVPGVSQYVLELENESADPEQSLSLNLPADVTSFTVPANWLVPGSEYQVGIATIAPNCNIVFVESTFQTAAGD
jgi:hypothetical protein